MNTDVEDVKFVINFDYPNNSEEYIHRIGRTGRSNNTGTAYTLFTIQNASKASDLVNVLKEANQVNTLIHKYNFQAKITAKMTINFFFSIFIHK